MYLILSILVAILFMENMVIFIIDQMPQQRTYVGGDCQMAGMATSTVIMVTIASLVGIIYYAKTR